MPSPSADTGPGTETVPVLANARAGRGAGAPRDRIEAAFRESGLRAEVVPVEPAALRREVLDRVRAGVPLLGVSGGDGTLLTAATALAGSGTALLTVPTGTLNHFARRVGIDGVEDAARAAAGRKIATAPVGVVDDMIFLNTATFGLYADVVRRRERLRRWLGKWPAAAVAFAIRTTRLRKLDLTLEVDGERLHRQTPLLWIGMGRGSFPLVYESDERRRSPDIEIVIIRPSGALGALRLLARLSLAIRTRTLPIADPALEVLHARWVLVRAEHPGVGVTLDGETTRLVPPIYVGVADEALRVAVLE